MTAKSIALISGKGGSGKTTLGLSMASLLSSCNVKVLLIDCDLSTNGATYFYEEKLSDANEGVSSFMDVFHNEKYDSLKLLPINSSYDFLPSVTSINHKYTKNRFGDGFAIDKFYESVSSKYEVIIFDCQAGYSEVLKTILPFIDLNLAVLEADAISSSAMRSLYLKIGNLLNDKKIYQVFNKTSTEEYNTYSKISGGTIFTNIETIMFDWKIRKAFSVAQIPDMENTSADYGKRLLSICNIILPKTEIQNKLNKFSTILEINKHSEIISTLKETISNRRSEDDNLKQKAIRKIFVLTAFLTLIVLSAVYIVLAFKSVNSEPMPEMLMSIILSIGVIFSIVFSFYNILEIRIDRRTTIKELHSYQYELAEHLQAQKELKIKLEKMNKKQKKINNELS